MSYRSGDQPQDSGTPPAEYHPSPRKARWPWITAGLLLVLALLAGGFTFAENDDENAVDEITVTYEVRGTGSDAAITYMGRDQGMARETAVSLPWRKDVPIGAWGRIVSMTAANGPDGGDITCRILVAGRVMTEQTSSGPYASASCSGNAGEQ
ncbi:MmpS family transport accessory protein [Nocardia carnea]|uniref:MmpS family transport accessory protein n=1 Tax=Nocardia carnea TaxID=37328 RepID=UPI0024578A0A|nr:MmpS family transport accessory protein [Nocardia carnea]